MSDETELKRLADELEVLQHAMQTGVGMKMAYSGRETTPKYLRVGINADMVFHGALVKLLVDKGVLTKLEYYTAIVEAMRNEVDSYRRWLSDYLGDVNLRLV